MWRRFLASVIANLVFELKQSPRFYQIKCGGDCRVASRLAMTEIGTIGCGEDIYLKNSKYKNSKTQDAVEY